MTLGGGSVVITNWVAGAAATAKLFVTAALRVLFEACRVSPAAALSSNRPLNVATPALAGTDVVPPRVPALELAASRVIAQNLGVSLFSWTGVIGVMLAGTCLGNFVGGRVADRFEHRLCRGPDVQLGGAHPERRHHRGQAEWIADGALERAACRLDIELDAAAGEGGGIDAA